MRDLLRMQRGKKGQAAMEFLMTYGWALLVVLVAIGALAFFGVLNPGQFLPDQCTFFSGVSCTNYIAKSTVTTDALLFDVTNGLGYTMKGLLITLSNPATGVTLTGPCGTTSGDFSDGATKTCKYTTSTAFAKGQKVKTTASLTWKDSNNNDRSRTGSLALTAE